MTYRGSVQDWIDGLEFALSANKDPKLIIDVVKVSIRNYAPKWLDFGLEMDRLYQENERLTAIVNLIDLKNENDNLKRQLAEKANG